jgi:putative Mg2+ transporter-C (MgtC) family protein
LALKVLMAVSATVFAIHSGNWGELAVRLVVAVLLGGAIGWDRQIVKKAAGLRTHMLVSLGSALFIMAPLEMGATPDGISRSIQGVATGIGFLGAGEIVQRIREPGKPVIKGLTSAASIWVTAAIGVLVGCGLWQVSVIATLLTILILVVAKPLERFLPERDGGMGRGE